MKTLSAIGTLIVLAAPQAFAAQTLTATGGDVGFLAVGKPSAIKIHGTGPAPTGQITVNGKEVSGELSFKMDQLTTGIELRDKHMKEKYLQTQQYPTATFKITKLTLPSDFTTSGFKADGVPVQGDLTLHGQTKPVSGTANISSAGGSATAHVAFSANITDYKIEIPSYMGIKVADHVDIETDVTATPASSSKK